MAVSNKDNFSTITDRFKEVKIFFIIFYAVGIAGLLIPFTFSLFLRLIPFALILSFIALALFHKDKTDVKSLVVFLIIYALGFMVEAIGVNTQLIFGNYQYGDSLGFKLFNTPLIIGLNWLLLVYITSSVIEEFKLKWFPSIILASTIMLVYDIILEQVASQINMWQWSHNIIPIQNYIAWFIIAVLFQYLIKAFRVRTENKLAQVILICQFAFFISLYLILKVIQ